MREHVFVRSAEEQKAVERLLGEGASWTEVSRLTGVPRSTVRNWSSGSTTAREGRPESCARCGGVHQRPDLDAGSYAYLLGQYLGDGHVQAFPRGVHKLSVACCGWYPGVLREVMDAVAAVVPRSKVSWAAKHGANAVDVYAYAKAWPCLLPQHGPGRKHERAIALEPWQRVLVEAAPGRFLRGLVHSDGWRGTNTVRAGGRTYRYSRYEFSNRSQDLHDLFGWACDLLGVEHRRNGRWTSTVNKRASVALLDEHVGEKA